MRPALIFRRLVRLWEEPVGLPPSLRLEWRLTILRWLAMLFVAPGLPLLNLPDQRLAAAYVLLGLAAIFNATVTILIRRRALAILPYLSAVGDSVLVIVMLSIAGGFDSPFSYIAFVIVMAIAMRFGYGPSFVITLLFIGANVAFDLSASGGIGPSTIFRASFLVLATLLASYLREQAQLARAALEQRNTELHAAYAELAAAHQELMSVDALKTNFLANVSHELRTPLSSIRSFSELLLNYDDPEVRQEFLQIINSESERLTRLVNDVLDVTRIEAGEMDWRFAEVDAGALAHQAARTHATLIEYQGLAFKLEIDPGLPPVYGDRDRLQQVLGNLLSNAAKFTPSGTITLGARRVEHEVQFSVADTGIGIAPGDQERIFDKFQQVGAVLTNKPRGTGLGLAICRDIVQYHGGRLWVASRPGEGSAFTFSVPISQGVAPSPPQVAALV